MAKVTIVTGYFNRIDYVNDSIKSLINQNYEDFNIIVFDDASSDGTFDRLKLITKDCSNVKLIQHKKNIGFVSGLINVCKDIESDYIAIHGSGDISYLNRIKIQAEYLDSHPNVGVVSSWTQTLDLNDNKFNNPAYKLVHSTQDLIKSNSLAHGASMFRNSIYRKAGGYRSFFTYAQDRDLWLRMSLYSQVHVLPQFLYGLRKPNNTVSRDLTKLIIQIQLFHFSAQLLIMRKNLGFDFIDLYKNNAGLFNNKSHSSRNINKLIIYQFYLNKRKNLNFLIQTSKSVNNSKVNLIFLTVVFLFFNNSLLKNIIIKFLKARWKDSKINDYNDVDY